ncbi:uncharacterized protein LOC116203566 isoform X1 [Punica granatum]|uniref:Uncharacterized protein LOC116203566 isoform X1 n=2 Tax=Punica granatum TaxID=22663 RepID=A0A6P8D272_PUNGR|nr:uncharacterized protein LOC116203566 isoform X1 [Punica granatum]PKI71658.1 hypothetical protein CRG98_007981 [Punica granatum]
MAKERFDIPALEKRYIDYCRRHGVPPNSAVISGLFKADAKRAHNGTCNLEIVLDQFKDIDFLPLLNVLMDVDESLIESVDIRNESSCMLSGEYALSLMRAVNKKLRNVDIDDFSFGRIFLRDLSHRGLGCEVLNLRSSPFRKLNMMGQFERLHTLNLDYSSSLTSFREDCFSCMPNLRFLSMCETRVSNLFTTVAALSKIPSLTVLRFQKWLFSDDAESFVRKRDDRSHSHLSLPNLDGYSEASPIDIEQEMDENSSTSEFLRNLFSLDNLVIDQEMQSANEESDDSELDFSSLRQDNGLREPLSDVFSWRSGRAHMQYEVNFGTSQCPNEEDLPGFSSPTSQSNSASKYISCYASPICFEKHYRAFMIASLPNLKVLDNLPIRKIDKEWAARIFAQHFEYLPYRRKAKESIVSILWNREIKSSHSRVTNHNNKTMCSSGSSQHHYMRSLCAAKVGSSCWPSLQPLSCTDCSLGLENLSFRPRQFEYHPSNPSLMVFGTLDGVVVVVNHESGKIVSQIPSLGEMSSVLGLSWLKKHPYKLIAGSDNGSLRLYDIQSIPPVATRTHLRATPSPITFDDFEQLTSVHVNSTDELFVASGYSRNVALYDIGSGRRLEVFTDMHQEHINVVKFSNHSPSIFATSSFDRDVKLWDLRQKPIRPCYTASSSKGNVMVCFSPDDHYLLTSAVDNEVKQLLAADGRIHLDFGIAPTGSSQNYTRSYYLNGRDYIVSGSCDQHVVRVCCAQTGRRLMDVSLEGRGLGTSMFVQSLRGDPFREFNMSILAAYMRPNSRSEIFKVNLLASSGHASEYACRQSVPPSNSMGG